MKKIIAAVVLTLALVMSMFALATPAQAVGGTNYHLYYSKPHSFQGTSSYLPVLCQYSDGSRGWRSLHVLYDTRDLCRDAIAVRVPDNRQLMYWNSDIPAGPEGTPLGVWTHVWNSGFHYIGKSFSGKTVGIFTLNGLTPA